MLMYWNLNVIKEKKIISEFWIQQLSGNDAILLRLGRADIGNYMRSFIY